jgi:hypothetical protein
MIDGYKVVVAGDVEAWVNANLNLDDSTFKHEAFNHSDEDGATTNIFYTKHVVRIQFHYE